MLRADLGTVQGAHQTHPWEPRVRNRRGLSLLRLLRGGRRRPRGGLLHTGEQAWDLRRLVWWLRESEGASAIGALGHSLGGYTVSLLASLERDLDCVVVGNPAVNPSHLFWTDALAVATHSLSAEGIREETFEALLRPVSPLALEPVVPHERRGIFAGVIDRVVPPVEANSLWRHWDRPRIAWYQGAHQRFIRAPEGRKILEETLRTADMFPKETTGTASQR